MASYVKRISLYIEYRVLDWRSRRHVLPKRHQPTMSDGATTEKTNEIYTHVRTSNLGRILCNNHYYKATRPTVQDSEIDTGCYSANEKNLILTVAFWALVPCRWLPMFRRGVSPPSEDELQPRSPESELLPP